MPGMWTTVTDRWPLTSGWKSADWPANQTAASKGRRPATPFSLLFSSHNAAISYPPAADHRAPSSSPFTCDYRSTPLLLFFWQFPSRWAAVETGLPVISSINTSWSCFIGEGTEGQVFGCNGRRILTGVIFLSIKCCIKIAIRRSCRSFSQRRPFQQREGGKVKSESALLRGEQY